MLASDYDKFVFETDLNKPESPDKRRAIAIYGLVGELGALTSAVKRRLIAETHGQQWNSPTNEIIEELGDSLWYWSALAMLEEQGSENLLQADIRNLIGHLSGSSSKARMFRRALGAGRVANFLTEASALAKKAPISLNDYQSVAVLTARTEGKTFVGVCLTVLSQLGAELLRINFPQVEFAINTIIKARPVDVILGEVAWHLSAITNEFGKTLDDIAEKNRAKINRRLDKSKPTASHDERYPSHERFPRKFEVSFIMTGSGRSRMYLDGKQIGDELTDNSYEDDGYRFHDVMHLANVAHLGWSPVLRGLLNVKRKSNKKTDEVEDGARAKIVEEAVIKAIHSEGLRISKYRIKEESKEIFPLIVSNNEISFQFLGFIENLVQGLEAASNQYWEWEDVIIQGNEVFCELRKEEQGTVRVDLDRRMISFSPNVCIDGPGVVVGMGSAAVDATGFDETERLKRTPLDWAGEGERLAQSDVPALEIAKEIATKQAILSTLDLALSEENYSSLRVRALDVGVSVKATGAVRTAMWRRKVIAFRTTMSAAGSTIGCAALAIADAKDAVL